MWRNQDHNSNQGAHEIEVLQNIKAVAIDMLKSASDGKVKDKDLIARAGRRNPSKIPPTSLVALSKFYCGFLHNGAPDLIQELVEFHAATVDPNELTVATSFFESLNKEEHLATRPFTRLALAICQYNSGSIKRSMGVGKAQVAALLEPSRSRPSAISQTRSSPWRRRSERCATGTSRSSPQS